MKFLHVVIDQDGKVIETLYSANNNPKFSMECLAKIKGGEYKIFNR
jgi:hypothetical protein